ncbi:zinc ribbon domain-containing protein [Miniphocaeibacter halophilus]|uniref:Zinc-ribbon domain-containing protein n=1 Tax=Miniphocaeibacter halophilus TaxID=2931922 RepID=A0AC61MZ37_9FIRM|nr:zinc ribbon domain-containing protein [Miniphocaeibacter halophilus]QQK08551.1 zinc-ribbon domain-containing protein [Miniphocaeibacter halophilus]
MYCPNCGKKIPSKSKFCPMCGFNIKEFFDSALNDNEDIDLEESKVKNTENTKIEDIEKNNIDELNNKEKTTSNRLEDLFVSKEDSKEVVEDNNEESKNIDYEEDYGSTRIVSDLFKETNSKDTEDNSVDNNNIENNNTETSTETNTEKRSFKEYINVIKEYTNKIIFQIKKSQEFIYNKTQKSMQQMVLGESKYLNLFIILTTIALIIPTFSIVRVFLAGKTVGKFIGFIIMLLGTILNLCITAAGPLVSLKALSFNYVPNMDKASIKTITIYTTTLISILKLLAYFLGNIVISMQIILYDQFSFRIILTTIIILLIEAFFIQALLWNKFKKDNYLKVFSTIIISVIIAELLSVLISKPIIFILLDIVK